MSNKHKHAKANRDQGQRPAYVPPTEPKAAEEVAETQAKVETQPAPKVVPPEPKAEVDAENVPAEPEQAQQTPAQDPMDPARMKRLVVVTDGKRFDLQLNQMDDITVRALGALLVNFTTP